MIKNSHVFLVAICLVGFTSQSTVAQSTAKRAGGQPAERVVRGVFRDIEPASIDQLSVEADLVLEGTLVRTRTYLTSDERVVLTDYRILPTRVIRGRLPDPTTTASAPKTLILSVVGGDLVVNGEDVRGVDFGLELPKDKGRFLLFLRKFNDEWTYQLHRGGIFEIANNGLRNLLTQKPEGYRDITSMPLEAVVERVREARRK